MDKIEKCNPNTKIHKHISVSLDKIQREAGRFIGFILPSGYQLTNRFDVLSCIYQSKVYDQSHYTFGGTHCNHKEENTGCCLGHKTEISGAPRDFKITAIKNDELDSFEQIAHGDTHMYPRVAELADAQEGDFITLMNTDGKKAIKLVITCSCKVFQGVPCVGVWHVLQRTKPNGKVQYSV